MSSRCKRINIVSSKSRTRGSRSRWFRIYIVWCFIFKRPNSSFYFFSFTKERVHFDITINKTLGFQWFWIPFHCGQCIYFYSDCINLLTFMSTLFHLGHQGIIKILSKSTWSVGIFRGDQIFCIISESLSAGNVDPSIISSQSSRFVRCR